MSSAIRKAEDTTQGCRNLERNSRELAAATIGEHRRTILERSANAWSARAQHLSGLERTFLARAVKNQGGRSRRSNKEVAENG